MYSFEPSEEQKMLVDAINRFASSDLRPKAREADEEAQITAKLVEKGWELGFLQASIPESYGGFGEYSAVSGVLAAEALAYGDLAGAMAVNSPALFALPILLAGSEEQKKKYLPAVVEAEWKPYTAALIEPSFDFDPNELDTKAVEDGDGLIISGEKLWVPYAGEAEAMIVYARLNNQTEAFIVEKGAEGLTIGERQKVMGIKALPIYALKLEGVRVPKANRLGEQERVNFQTILAHQRLAMSAMAVGLSKAALDYACNYAKDREVFGMKIGQKQAIAFMIAEMATEIEAIRTLVWEAAWMLDNSKEEANKEAYLAFTGAADMSMMVTDRAVQILGGHGYIREHPVEMWMRNGRGIATLNGLAIV